MKSDQISPLRGHGSKFSHKKEEAIQALLTQRSMEEAARVAGITRQTLARWLKIPEFQQAYLEARRQLVSQSNARLQQYSSAAVTVLAKLMTDQATPAAARVRAARHIIDGAKQAVEFEDIEVRLAALERARELEPGR